MVGSYLTKIQTVSSFLIVSAVWWLDEICVKANHCPSVSSPCEHATDKHQNPALHTLWRGYHNRRWAIKLHSLPWKELEAGLLWCWRSPGTITLTVLAGERACTEVLVTESGLCLKAQGTQDSKVIYLCMQGPAVLSSSWCELLITVSHALKLINFSSHPVPMYMQVCVWEHCSCSQPGSCSWGHVGLCNSTSDQDGGHCGVPAHRTGVGTRWSLKSFWPQPILWFYDI